VSVPDLAAQQQLLAEMTRLANELLQFAPDPQLVKEVGVHVEQLKVIKEKIS
jgi:hypothetical protein